MKMILLVSLALSLSSFASTAKAEKPCGQAPSFLKAKVAAQTLLRMTADFQQNWGKPVFAPMCKSFADLCSAHEIWKDSIEKPLKTLAKFTNEISDGFKFSQNTCIDANDIMAASDYVNAFSLAGIARLLSEAESLVLRIEQVKKEMESQISRVDQMSDEEKAQFMKRYSGVTMEIASEHARERLVRIAEHLRVLASFTTDSIVRELSTKNDEVTKQIQAIVDAFNGAAEKSLETSKPSEN